MKLISVIGITALMAFSAQLTAGSVTIDFENGFSNGDYVYSIGSGFYSASVSATGGIGKARIFDSYYQNDDPDLQGPDFEDNKGATKTLGNLLIIQEEYKEGSNPQQNDTQPDDNARGGTITIDFDNLVTLLSIDVIDMPFTDNDPDKYFKADLFGMDGLIDSWTNTYSSETSGNEDSNMFETIVFSELYGISGVTRMELTLGHSGAIDNIVVSSVPLPAAAWLFGSALLGFVGIRRFKK